MIIDQKEASTWKLKRKREQFEPEKEPVFDDIHTPDWSTSECIAEGRKSASVKMKIGDAGAEGVTEPTQLSPSFSEANSEAGNENPRQGMKETGGRKEDWKTEENRSTRDVHSNCRQQSTVQY